MAHAGSSQAALVAIRVCDRPAKSRARPFRSSGALELENSPADIRRLNLAKQLAANASEISYAALRLLLLPPIIMGNLNVMYALCMLSLSTPYDVQLSAQVAFATWYLHWTPVSLNSVSSDIPQHPRLGVIIQEPVARQLRLPTYDWHPVLDPVQPFGL